MRKELSLSFNNDQIWAKQFLENHNKYLMKGILNYTKPSSMNNLPPSLGPIKIAKQNDSSVNSTARINIHQDAEEVVYH